VAIGAVAAAVIALGAGDLLRQPASSAADGTALVLGPSRPASGAAPVTSPPAHAPTAPAIAVIGDDIEASSVVKSLMGAGLHASVTATPTGGRLGPVSVPTILYRSAASAAASRVAAVLSSRLPGTTVAPMPLSTDSSSSVVVLLPATAQ
jgi:hypothetical protein